MKRAAAIVLGALAVLVTGPLEASVDGKKSAIAAPSAQEREFPIYLAQYNNRWQQDQYRAQQQEQYRQQQFRAQQQQDQARQQQLRMQQDMMRQQQQRMQQDQARRQQQQQTERQRQDQLRRYTNSQQAQQRQSLYNGYRRGSPFAMPGRTPWAIQRPFQRYGQPGWAQSSSARPGVRSTSSAERPVINRQGIRSSITNLSNPLARSFGLPGRYKSNRLALMFGTSQISLAPRNPTPLVQRPGIVRSAIQRASVSYSFHPIFSSLKVLGHGIASNGTERVGGNGIPPSSTKSLTIAFNQASSNSVALATTRRLNNAIKSGTSAPQSLTAARLQSIDHITGGHSFARHGAQTTIEQQKLRAQTGLTPDGHKGLPSNATRFLTHDNQAKAYLRAIREIRKGNIRGSLVRGKVEFDMPDIIGEGYYSGNLNHGTTNRVRAYVINGKIHTLFPILHNQT